MSNNNITRGYGLLEGFLAKQRANIANKLIDNSYRAGKILDIGCGSYPYFLNNTLFSFKFGLDKLTDEHHNKNRYSNINFINHDLEHNNQLTLESNNFDVVTMLAVFEHIEPAKIVSLLNEINRVLKVGGVFIITTPNILADKLLRIMAKLRLVSPVEIEEHKDAYNFSKITYLFEKSNFNVNNLKLGYFKMFLNIWCSIKK